MTDLSEIKTFIPLRLASKSHYSHMNPRNTHTLTHTHMSPPRLGFQVPFLWHNFKWLNKSFNQNHTLTTWQSSGFDTMQNYRTTAAFQICSLHFQAADLHLLFIDFKRAFDSINQKRLLKTSLSFGIPKKIEWLVRMTLEGAQAKVIVDGKISNLFNIGKGVRQGDGLSATMFNLVLHKALKKLN